ncbi:uncharacterized protein LOC105694929 [Orussus abietinus]|uniref:uncharacterized protein LOC105694929 n=1 Tax=Orussus abietinus TaxID=222816 RepID=UPI000624F7AB|nr:uncharacterized protein LOC105694929 [Orussus abietinus]XP_012271506.1 uncharacterized protein LOC105694929 [Orussus abietinus]
MAHLYPPLDGVFRKENVCPICTMEMEFGTKYMCSNSHVICRRCKPYYHSCPICRSPLDVEIPPPELSPHQGPPAMHCMPHPMVPPYDAPSAPPPEGSFLHQERVAWEPPSPSPDQELLTCRYAHLGCRINVPRYLQELHEARCPCRPPPEEDQEVSLRVDEDLPSCRYRNVGCNVRMPSWKIGSHERICIYKDRCKQSGDSDEEYGDGDQLVSCRFRRHGCAVRMPRRRKSTHEMKCNYSKYYQSDEENESGGEESYRDPDEQVECRWADRGCRVRPKFGKKETHEERCNYRMEECPYKSYGCDALFEPSRKFVHLKSCEFAG